jgi:hypothetical protein
VPRITYPEFERTALFTAGAYAAHHGLGSWWHGHWGGTVPESQRKIPEKKVK